MPNLPSKHRVKTASQAKPRPTAAGRGYNYRWQRARLAFLAEHPLCATCKANGLTAGAEVVDHKTPHRGDQELFWDRSNWQPLCRKCHSEKTARGL